MKCPLALKLNERPCLCAAHTHEPPACSLARAPSPNCAITSPRRYFSIGQSRRPNITGSPARRAGAPRLIKRTAAVCCRRRLDRSQCAARTGPPQRAPCARSATTQQVGRLVRPACAALTRVRPGRPYGPQARQRTPHITNDTSRRRQHSIPATYCLASKLLLSLSLLSRRRRLSFDCCCLFMLHARGLKVLRARVFTGNGPR
jgi:hypothetical protein